MDTEKQPPKAYPAPLGGIEPHTGLLVAPPEGQLLDKLMTIENLLRSIEDSYLYFSRVDGYQDFPGADPHDGQQLPADQPGNLGAKFEKAPEYSVADYYDQCRARTYACCFGLENADYLWNNYANGSEHGKVGIVFNFSKLRARLNQSLVPEQTVLTFNGITCRQIFSVNYGVIEYVDWERHQANTEHLPNPIQYTYLKGIQFSDEKELRVSLSTLGMGQFALNGGKIFEFPPGLSMQFDFRAALMDGAIQQLLLAPDSDAAYLHAELARLGISPATDGDASI